MPGLGRLAGVFARHRTGRGDAVGLQLGPEGGRLFPVGAPDPLPAPGIRASA
jgi:hypothetical protein